jgi:hypothetical protein
MKLGIKYYCKYCKWEWRKYCLLVGNIKNHALNAFFKLCHLVQTFLLHTSVVYVMREAKIWYHLVQTFLLHTSVMYVLHNTKIQCYQEQIFVFLKFRNFTEY